MKKVSLALISLAIFAAPVLAEEMKPAQTAPAAAQANSQQNSGMQQQKAAKPAKKAKKKAMKKAAGAPQ